MLQSVEALEAWKALYQQTRDKIATGRSSALWNFDETDVFAQTNAFIHRCRCCRLPAGFCSWHMLSGFAGKQCLMPESLHHLNSTNACAKLCL